MIQANGKWITVDTENPEFWCDQAYAFRGSHITSVRLVKKIDGKHPDNGLEIVTTPGDKSLFNRFWMRYESFEKAEDDFENLMEILADGGY